MLLVHFIQLLIRSGLLFTSGLITKRAISNLLFPPLQLTPVVQIEDGDIQGKIGYSRNGSEYWQFLGIPYALPPVVALRFQPPIPARRWYELKQVITFPSACVQYDSMVLMRALGEEDCLYINVFMNPAKSTNKKPVLVYIHGGIFLTGESQIYHPDYFMDHPIVLVTFNYRLGPFGFLNFQENDPSQRFPRGNMGLKDQNLALQWVQRNIADFGGDPDQVTIMGESSGAASVHFHTLSSLSQGLFHRAILLSGSAMNPWAFSERPRNLAVNYAKRLGCSTGNWTVLFKCYMRFDAKELVQYQTAWANPLQERDLFVPSEEIESYSADDDTFLTASPENLLRSYGKRIESSIPLMMGVTSGEGGVRSARFQAVPELISELDTNWDQLIGRVLLLEEPNIESSVAQELKYLYFGNGSGITKNLNKFLKNLTRLSSDVLFYEPIHIVAKEHSKFAPTYMFYYDYESAMLPGAYSFYGSVSPRQSRVSDIKLIQGLYRDWTQEHMLGQRGVHKYGVGHGEELFQLWNINGLSRVFSDEDMKFSQSFVQTIVDFSSNKKPLTFRGTAWPRVSAGVSRKNPDMLLPYMLIDHSGKGRLTEEPFYSNKLQALKQIFNIKI